MPIRTAEDIPSNRALYRFGKERRQSLSQLPCGRPGHDDAKAHSVDPDRRAASGARTWASSRTSPRSVHSCSAAERSTIV
jgi:hypothetical protein